MGQRDRKRCINFIYLVSEAANKVTALEYNNPFL